uniref:Uncharacterized protein n=1 Tax=Dicentrarchus labrax TaxID=13489 RepID=A0A8C4IJJ8_DICLA
MAVQHDRLHGRGSSAWLILRHTPINHSMLLFRFESSLSITGTALLWFKSYSPIVTSSLVSTNSTLVPLIFILYAPHFGHIIPHHALYFHCNADVTALHLHQIHHCLHLLHPYKLNNNKSGILIIGSKSLIKSFFSLCIYVLHSKPIFLNYTLNSGVSLLGTSTVVKTEQLNKIRPA